MGGFYVDRSRSQWPDRSPWAGIQHNPALSGIPGSFNYPYEPGDPMLFEPTIGLYGELVKGLLGQYDPTTRTPYQTPPEAGRLGNTLGALRSMTEAGAATPGTFGGGYGLSVADVDRYAAPAMRGLQVAEVDRIQALLQSLLSAYGLSGQIYGEQQQEVANLKDIETKKRQAQQAFWSQIPVIGGLVGGFRGLGTGNTIQGG